MNLKLIVFDLDDTLLDTTRLLIPIANTPEFEKRISSSLPLMPSAKENLEYLKKKYTLVLLTQGKPKFQEQKIDSLKIRDFFKKIYIANAEIGETKADLFPEILKDFSCSPIEMLSIGNRMSTDIREAKKVGGWTCWFRYGEHQNEKVECAEDKSDFEIGNHQELISTCHL